MLKLLMLQVFSLFVLNFQLYVVTTLCWMPAGLRNKNNLVGVSKGCVSVY